MKRGILFFYKLLSWLIVLVLFVALFTLIVLDRPATFLSLLKSPLEEYGVQYGKMEGSLLTGFSLYDVNYEGQVKAKKVALKVDLKALEKRILYVENVELENLQIEESFLTNLIENNSSSEVKEESNATLPFDYVIVKNVDVSLENLKYEGYNLNTSKLQINNFESDLKEQHKGSLKFEMDANVAQAKLEAKIRNDAYVLRGNIEGEQSFINQFTKDLNISFEENLKLKLLVNGDMKALAYEVDVKKLALAQNEYKLHSEALNLKGDYDLKEQNLKAELLSDINANVATFKVKAKTDVNLQDINNSLGFNLSLDLTPKEKLFVQEFEEQNITLEHLPKIHLLANGSLRKSNFNLMINGLKARQNEMALDLKDLRLKGEVQALKGDTKVELLTHFDSSVASGMIDGKTALNFKDVNNSLGFDVRSEFVLEPRSINKLLADTNVTLSEPTPLNLMAKGSLKKSNFNFMIQGLKARQNKMALDLKDLLLKGEVQALKGDTKVELLTHFDSSVASGMIDGKTALNFKDVNNSLGFDVRSELNLEPAYINTFLTDTNVTLSGETPVNLRAKGDMKKLKVKLLTTTGLLTQGIESAVKLQTEEVRVNLQEHTVEGGLSLQSNAQNIALDLKSRFKGNYTEVEKLKTDSTLNLKSFNAFGVNLNSLTPLNLKANNEGKRIRLALDSQKIQLEASSQDLNAVDFRINTDKIYPSKIVELDAELDEKFIQLDLKGSSTISERYVTLKGALESNKNFKVLIDAVNSEEGLEAKLSSEHFKLEANGNIGEKDVEANLEIDSLKKLQNELQRLYPFTTVNVDGAMKLNAKLKGEQIKAALRSKKLTLEAFNVEEIALNADYANDLLQIDTLNFKTTGFKDKSLNQNFYLKQKGLVNLGEKREVLLDMHPKILIKGSGDSENLKATVQIEELLLGYPNYGRTQLSCDIDYLQTGEKKKIMGAVFLDKMKIVYESKFLDPSADNDVVIINKKEKQTEGKDAFLEDTFIDLTIYAGEANYKTRDIDLTLDVNVKAQKAFAKPLVMLGKVENINGRVEQAPKLFTVVDSNIVFQGREEINPLLDLTVEHELPDILITISIHGNAKRPKLTFTSQPPLPKKDILSYLLLGVSTASLAEGKGSLGREAQLFIMNQAARDLAYEVELDRVFIKDDGTGEGYAVQVGKKVQEDTMFVIETSKEGNSYILEYDVSKDVKVEVGRHQKTVPSQSIDLYYRKRFK